MTSFGIVPYFYYIFILGVLFLLAQFKSNYKCNVQTYPVDIVDTTCFLSPTRSRASSPRQVNGELGGVWIAAS